MKDFKIHFLNTIWSDAIILEASKHYGFLDTGSSFYYPMITSYLNDLNIKTIDFIILSHFHSDHYGNVKNIIENYDVKTLYLKRYYGLDGTTSSGYQSNEEYIENEFKNYYDILAVAKKHNTNVIFVDELNKDILEIDFQGVTLELYDIKNTLYEMYNDKTSEYYQIKKFNDNFNSLGVFIRVNNKSIYLGADVTNSTTDIKPLHGLAEKMISKIYEKHNINHIDLYKSCHHGGGGTNPLSLCNLMKAKYVIITNTDRWLDNYPTYNNLKEANNDVVILKTDYSKYIFNIEDDITYQTINDTSLFITLKKD